MQASYRSSAYHAAASPRRRLAAILLALGIAALILLALLKMGGIVRPEFGDGRPLSTFDIAADGTRQRAATRQTTERRQAARATSRTAPAPARETPPVPAPPLPPTTLHLPGVMILSQADYRAADIGRIRGTAPAGAAAQSADAGDAGDSAAVGQGPGGEKLYAAEWYREPTRAEMSTYLPASGRVGWGIVACRTIERFHVEDCRELGESPGSGIARALRQAAWQFLVRPPRVGGRAQIGTWVRIRFDVLAPKRDSDAAPAPAPE